MLRLRASVAIIHANGVLHALTVLSALEPSAQTDSSPRAAYTGTVAGVVVGSVAFIEGLINEHFSDVGDGWKPSVEKVLSPAAIEATRLAAPLVALSRGGPSLRAKYELALQLAGKPAMPKGVVIDENFGLLVDLRNALVHAQPIIADISTEDPISPESEKWEARFRYKFAETPWTSSRLQPYFPHRALSKDCALWAWRSAVAWTDAFYKALGTEPPYSAYTPSIHV